MELALAHRLLLRMVRALVREVALVVRHTDDASNHGGRAPQRAGDCSSARGWRENVRCHGLALVPLGPMVCSNKVKMRVYSSVQLDGRTKPWSSTG